jgi:hypothetical protein
MAKVQPSVLSGALIEASEIFSCIGVEIEWVDGSSRQRLGSSQLYLRIIPGSSPIPVALLGQATWATQRPLKKAGCWQPSSFTVSRNSPGETPRLRWAAPSPTNWAASCLSMIGGMEVLIQRAASCAAPGNDTTGSEERGTQCNSRQKTLGGCEPESWNAPGRAMISRLLQVDDEIPVLATGIILCITETSRRPCMDWSSPAC